MCLIDSTFLGLGDVTSTLMLVPVFFPPCSGLTKCFASPERVQSQLALPQLPRWKSSHAKGQQFGLLATLQIKEIYAPRTFLHVRNAHSAMKNWLASFPLSQADAIAMEAAIRFV